MFLQQILNYAFLVVILSSYIKACPETMQDGWKQLSLAERTRKADVVAVGTAVKVHVDSSLVGTNLLFRTGGFKLSHILKGHKIIESIYANTNQSIFYILGFGEPSLCHTHIVKGETTLLFANFVPKTMSLVVPLNIPFGGTAPPTVKNQDEILDSLGKQIYFNKCHLRFRAKMSFVF